MVGTNWTHPLPRDVDQHGKAGEVGAGAGDSHHPPLPPLHTTHPRHISRRPAAVANATTNQRCDDYNIRNELATRTAAISKLTYSGLLIKLIILYIFEEVAFTCLT